MRSITYKEYLDKQTPSMCEGNPCSPGTKIIAINRKTHQVQVTEFNPEELTLDWGIIYKETDDRIDKKELVLYNLLIALGYEPGQEFKFSDERLNQLVHSTKGDK